MATRQLTKAAGNSDNFPIAAKQLLERARTLLDYAVQNDLATELGAIAAGDVVAGAGSQTKAEFVDELRTARALRKLLIGDTTYDSLPLGAAPTTAEFDALIKKLGL